MNKSHGHCLNYKASSTYGTWNDMLQRCQNPNHARFKDYGGRGIEVCENWQTFAGFLGDMGERPSPELQLDRINNDEGYYKENCRWVTAEENNSNKRPYSKATNNQSGITGVSYHENKSRWTSYIGRHLLYNGKDFFQACCARKAFEAKKKGLNGGYV